MPAQDRYIPGVPCWIDTTQPDVDAAAAFYGGLFGWTFEEVSPAATPGSYRIARIRGNDVAAVASPPPGTPPVATWNSYVWVADADGTAAEVRAAGGAVIAEPMDISDSGRMAVCADPGGAVFSIWQAREHRGATIVNEHGSLNFNTLRTRDVDAAAAFYAAVFGWELLDIGSGLMWTLPAYGELLESRTPGLRGDMAKMGAPDGFIDVVAAVQPLTRDDGDVPEHWSVTFAVDDADATAALATELGGRVIAAPADAPWVRMTVIADPQGASFIASTFVPENRQLEAGATAVDAA